MNVRNEIKKDVKRYLGIIPDKRRKDFKQFIAENGGYNHAIETLKSRFCEQTEFKDKKKLDKASKNPKGICREKQN